MIYEMPMPSLGADMETGKLVEWKMKVGDLITKGQTVAIVETQKAAVEIESFRAGRVVELIGRPGQEIEVGTPIARLDVESADLGASPAAAQAAPRVKASPAARKRAEELGLDLSALAGSGPGGVIELRDIEQQAGPVKRATQNLNQESVREAIARQMARSKKEIPHYYLSSAICLDRTMAWLDQRNASLSPADRIMAPSLFLRAIGLALKVYPDFNGFFVNGKFKAASEIHLGVALAMKPSGVMVPALLNVHEMNLTEMNAAVLDLIKRMRSGGLKNRELTDGTFTVTNVGDLGAQEVMGVIFPPQVAIVGIGRICQEAIVDKGQVRAGLVSRFTLSADHRVTDGLAGSRFLRKIETLLAEPEELEG